MSESRGFIKNHHIIQATTMGASVNSAPIDGSSLSHIVIEAVWSAGTSPVGTVALQGSVTGTNWIDIGTPVSVSGASGFGFNQTASASAYGHIRVRFTRTSGTGTLNVYLSAK